MIISDFVLNKLSIEPNVRIYSLTTPYKFCFLKVATEKFILDSSFRPSEKTSVLCNVELINPTSNLLLISSSKVITVSTNCRSCVILEHRLNELLLSFFDKDYQPLPNINITKVLKIQIFSKYFCKYIKKN